MIQKTQKNLFASMLSAAVKYKMLILCFVLIFGMIFPIFLPQLSVMALSRQTAGDLLGKTTEAVEAANLIYQKLREVIVEQIDSMDVEDDSEFDIDEAEASHAELTGYAVKLDGLLSDLRGLPDDLNTSEGKTIHAAKEYLTMLRNITIDSAELLRYTTDLYIAILAMESMDVDPNDFEVLAEAIWEATDNTKIQLEQIKPPSYLSITHSDLITRVTEFRDFAEDFYTACYLEDPLRIYSCVYRMTRIMRMFTICGDNLNADVELQFKQSEHRLNGPIAQLSGELSKNLNTLNEALAKGRG